jgi:RNA polymerase sigma factor (sigma-70 family)
MPETSTDLIQDWLERYRSGAQPPPDELVQICEDRVRALVRPRLRSFPRVRQLEDTTDIVNEALLRLTRALRDVTPATPLDLNRFLAELIRRVLLDKLKAIRRRDPPTAGLAVEPGREVGDTDHPVDADLMTEFHEYVRSLPDDERTLFDLLYYRGMSTATAAGYLGLPPTTLKRRWVSARLRARDWLGRDPAKT